MSDGLIKALSDLEDVRAEAPEPKTDSVIERMEKVVDLKMRGIGNTAIAKALGVDPSTVWRDLKRAREQYRETLEQEPAANLIADSLMFLDKIEEVCLFEASQASSGEAKVDPTTGEVTRDAGSNAKGKFQYIRAALTARDMKNKLMLDTGVMPREPDKLYHSIKKEEESKEEMDVRNAEEIRDQVLELLKRGRNL
jgi:DNA-binding CsgD family transcriptional regulator